MLLRSVWVSVCQLKRHAYQSWRHDIAGHSLCTVTGPIAWPGYLYALYLGFGIMLGLFAVSFSIAALEFSREYLNVSNDLSASINSAAYTVYLIQPLVLNSLAWVWVEILRSRGTKIEFPMNGGHASPSRLDSDVQVWLGFVVVGSASLLLCWPMAHVIRSLPGFNQIL